MERQRSRKTWQDEGNCSDYWEDEEINTDDFYADEKKGRIAAGTERYPAPGFCVNCPVKKECFNYSVLHEEYGYWAGTTERQRRVLRKNKVLLTTLAVDAISQGWLENHHLIPVKDYQEIEAALAFRKARNRQGPKKTHNQIVCLPELPSPIPEFDLTNSPKSQEGAGTYTSDAQPNSV